MHGVKIITRSDLFTKCIASGLWNYALLIHAGPFSIADDKTGCNCEPDEPPDGTAIFVCSAMPLQDNEHNSQLTNPLSTDTTFNIVTKKRQNNPQVGFIRRSLNASIQLLLQIQANPLSCLHEKGLSLKSTRRDHLKWFLYSCKLSMISKNIQIPKQIKSLVQPENKPQTKIMAFARRDA